MKTLPTLFSIVLLIVLAVTSGQSAKAHHGWGWASQEPFEIDGEIVGFSLGNPHGEVVLNRDGEDWLVEIGQPWRNERAGLTEERLSPGTDITVRGHRSNDPEERKIKAVRVIIDGEYYDLYPDRVF